MLAIEVVLSGSDNAQTFVFDEVDAGIGGRAAVEVGARLARLQLAGRLRIRWQNVLPFKFLGGLLTLGGGLTLGREGPSVQIGAAVGQGFAELGRRPFTERKFLVSSGAAAGLAAASVSFNLCPATA